MKRLYILIAAVLCAGSAAAVRFASPFGNGMVLQREKPVAVWGTADAGEKVDVTFAGQSVSATADADGRWLVYLAPMKACAEGRVLRANGAEVKDVLVGEVWLCSGQSNMAVCMWSPTCVFEHGNRDNNGYLDAIIVDEPLVRACTVPNAWSAEPRELANPLFWKRFAPGKHKSLSAIGFHYALTLHRALKVPVGVIVSARGSSRIEAWISPDGYRSVPSLAANADRPIATKAPESEKGRQPSLSQQPRALWNAMIHPLVPYTFRGVLWYQGEANRGQGLAYKDRLNALWNGWSKAFGDPEMPFYLVQIAPYDYGMKADSAGASDCDIWEAEESFARENPHAGMATIVDVGEHDNIHPGDKRTVALRLAALALNRTYGRKDVPCDNPALKSYDVAGDTVTLTFDHVENWLMHGVGAAPFEIAGTDGKFVPAKTKFLKGAVELRADGVAEPQQVRYLWNWCKAGRLKNDYGFPLAPFYVRSLKSGAGAFAEATKFLPDEGWRVSDGRWDGDEGVRQCERLGDRTRVRYDGTRPTKERGWITFKHDGAEVRPVANEGDTLVLVYEPSNPSDFGSPPCLRVADSKGRVFVFEPSKSRRLPASKVSCEFALDARRQPPWAKTTDGICGAVSPVSVSFVFSELKEQSGFIDFISLSRIAGRPSAARDVLVREAVYEFGKDTALDHTYPAGPKPIPAAETFVLNADVGGSPDGDVVMTLADRDTGRVVSLTSKLSPEMRFQADLPTGSFWVPRSVKFRPAAKSGGARPVWRLLSIERKESVAESLRFTVDTGNPLHLIRDGVGGERLSAVFRNPTRDGRRWKVRLDFSDFHGESFSMTTSVCAKAGEEVRVPVGSERFRMGHYRVRAEIEGEDGSTDVKESMFARIPLMARTPKIPFGKFRFGFNYHLGNYDEEESRLTLEAVVAAGAKIVRMTGPHFARIQPTGPDSWRWDASDRQIEMLDEAGLAVDAIIYQTPRWALAHPAKTNEPWAVWSFSVPRPDAFARFCTELSARYGDKIDYYEVGNEFDLRATNVFTAAEVVDVQKTAYAALKRGNRSVRVITNGWASDTDKPSMFRQKGVHEAVMRGAKGFYDAHPIHLHGWYDKYVARIRNFFEMRKRIGIADIPWYANETAMTGVHGMEGEVAETVWKKILWSWAHGSTDYIWYNLRATGWKPDDSEQNFGVITADYFPRPSYAAFAALAFACQGLDFDGVLHDDDCRQMYRFRGSREGRNVRVVTAWDTASARLRQSVRLETDASRATVMDLMGNVGEVAVEGGVVKFEFGAEPSLMTLWDAGRAEPNPMDLARSIADRDVKEIPPGSPLSRRPDFVLDGKRFVVDAYEANPETVDRTWRGPSDLSARVWLSRSGDSVDVVVETVDDALVPTAAGSGDRVRVTFLGADGVTRTTEAALASRGEKTVVWRASVSGMRGDAFRFNVSIDDDDGPGRDVTLTMPKPVDILFRENLK